MEVTGCSKEAAVRAIEAAGEGGIELAVDLVLSTMSSHWASADDVPSAPPTKMVCVVRQDLGMSTGKVAAQVSHGTLGAYRATQRRGAAGDESLRAWEAGGEPTIVLKVDDLAALEACMQQAEQRGLVAHRVADAGRTEVAAGSVTVGVIGPAANELIDQVTGSLSLLA
jgi:PTH2 family peptidyl-tRNA hydrolase